MLVRSNFLKHKRTNKIPKVYQIPVLNRNKIKQ